MKIKILSKIIEYGLYLLVFLLPIQTRWIIKAGQINGGYWEYGSISLYGTDILSLIILVLFIVRRFYLPECQMSNVKCQNKFQIPNPNLPAQAGQMLNLKFQTPIYWWFVFGLVLASVVSIFFASNKLLALFKFGWLMLGVGLFWLIIRSNYSKLKLILGLLAGIFLQAVLGIWQFLSQSSFSSKWLGMAYHEAANLGTSVVETIAANGTGERWLRAYGGLDHPNVLGGALTAGILLVIWVLLKEWEGKEFFPPAGDLPRGDNFQ